MKTTDYWLTTLLGRETQPSQLPSQLDPLPESISLSWRVWSRNKPSGWALSALQSREQMDGYSFGVFAVSSLWSESWLCCLTRAACLEDVLSGNRLYAKYLHILSHGEGTMTIPIPWGSSDFSSPHLIGSRFGSSPRLGVQSPDSNKSLLVIWAAWPRASIFP